MSCFTSVFQKIIEASFSEESICVSKNLLVEGNLLVFEQEFKTVFQTLESELFALFLNKLCQYESIESAFKNKAKSCGLSDFIARKTSLQIATGQTICLNSWYAYHAPNDYQGSRNLFHLFFKTCRKNSPLHTSNISSTAVICPSFEVAAAIMTEIGIAITPDMSRNVATDFAKKCENHADLILKQGETLAGKTVLIAIDGGRCRTRQPNNTFTNDSIYEGYDTPWVEPKLFVINTLDENGKSNKLDLPIFDATFGDDELFELLRTYLLKLDIHKAKIVQVAADGAPWIWNRVRPFLTSLGVAPENIIETLDYYHATEHITELVKYLPTEQQPNSLLLFKKLLWEGDIQGIKTALNTIFTDLDTHPLKPFDYFLKNAMRMNYKSYKENNLVCGSGIIESGIRRILNLRFKCPSAFWKPENVKPLIFLRAVFLSKRWEYLQNNFYKI